MAISNLLSGRVRLKGPKNVTSDRYEFVDLSQVEPNFGVPSFSASLESNPAILVSDSDGNRGFAQKIVLNEITSSFKGIADLSGSFSGSFIGKFSGDGSQLVNVPAVVAPRIASGSATASISPNLGLQINVDTTIAGNLYVSKSIYAESLIVTYISSSIIYSSGSNIFGDSSSDNQQLTGSVGIRDVLTVNSATGSFSGSFIGSANLTGSFTGSFSGSFSGDGSGLTNIPALTSTLIGSGSVTASIAPNTGLVVNTFSTFQFPVSASMFTGSGRGLFDIPESALSFFPNKIVSGSVTASVNPDFGFKVESVLKGSTFTGSILVSGSVTVNTGSFFVGDGRYLNNITLANLSIDSTKIFSGSVTASVSPDDGFVVTSKSGSYFYGVVNAVSGASFFSGTGVTALETRHIVSISYLDSPATTSATTYKTQARAELITNSGAVYFQNGSKPSTITLMEIGA